MTASILDRAQQLAAVERAFDRARQSAESGSQGHLVRATAGCAEQCPRCTIECAMLAAFVEEARQHLHAIISGSTGAFYIASGGRA